MAKRMPQFVYEQIFTQALALLRVQEVIDGYSKPKISSDAHSNGVDFYVYPRHTKFPNGDHEIKVKVGPPSLNLDQYVGQHLVVLTFDHTTDPSLIAILLTWHMQRRVPAFSKSWEERDQFGQFAKEFFGEWALRFTKWVKSRVNSVYYTHTGSLYVRIRGYGSILVPYKPCKDVKALRRYIHTTVSAGIDEKIANQIASIGNCVQSMPARVFDPQMHRFKKVLEFLDALQKKGDIAEYSWDFPIHNAAYGLSVVVRVKTVLPKKGGFWFKPLHLFIQLPDTQEEATEAIRFALSNVTPYHRVGMFQLTPETDLREISDYIRFYLVQQPTLGPGFKHKYRMWRIFHGELKRLVLEKTIYTFSCQGDQFQIYKTKSNKAPLLLEIPEAIGKGRKEEILDYLSAALA